MLPQLAQGDANKVWVIPSEFTQALGNLGGVVSGSGAAAPAPPPPPPPPGRLSRPAATHAAVRLHGVFDSLSEKLQATLADLRSRGTLTEDDVDRAMREIRLALLEADVNFKVVKSSPQTVKERCLGADVIGGLNPGQQVVKIVDEELAALMGGASVGVTFAPRPPTVILLAGLQGSGKTTATAKLARFLQGGARLVGRARGLRRLSPGGGRAARDGGRAGRRRRSTSAAPTRTRSRSPPGRSTRPSATARTC